MTDSPFIKEATESLKTLGGFMHQEIYHWEIFVAPISTERSKREVLLRCSGVKAELAWQWKSYKLRKNIVQVLCVCVCV